MDFAELIDAHIERDADITIAAQPVTPDDATQMGIFRFDAPGQITGFEEKPKAERLAEMGSSAPRPHAGRTDAGQAVRGVDGHLRVLARRAARRARAQHGRGFRPARSSRRRSARIACIAYLYRGYWADVGTVQSFYDVNLMLTRRGAPFNFFHPTRPIYTPAAVPAGRAPPRLAPRRGARRRGRLPRHVRGPRQHRRHPHVDPAGRAR